MKVLERNENMTISASDVEIYLDEHDKSELSRIIWKMEQLKAAAHDPNQLKMQLNGDALIPPETMVIK